MRAITNEIQIEDYCFKVEFDSGGDPDYPFIVWITKNDEPLLYKESNMQVRRYFKQNVSEKHLNNFCLKFVNNEEYRNRFLVNQKRY